MTNIFKGKITPANDVLSVEMIQNAINNLQQQSPFRTPRYLITPEEMQLVRQEVRRTGETIESAAQRLEAEGRIIPIPIQ
jgi:hypothetical protein